MILKFFVFQDPPPPSLSLVGRLPFVVASPRFLAGRSSRPRSVAPSLVDGSPYSVVGNSSTPSPAGGLPSLVAGPPFFVQGALSLLVGTSSRAARLSFTVTFTSGSFQFNSD